MSNQQVQYHDAAGNEQTYTLADGEYVDENDLIQPGSLTFGQAASRAAAAQAQSGQEVDPNAPVPAGSTQSNVEADANANQARADAQANDPAIGTATPSTGSGIGGTNDAAAQPAVADPASPTGSTVVGSAPSGGVQPNLDQAQSLDNNAAGQPATEPAPGNPGNPEAVGTSANASPAGAGATNQSVDPTISAQQEDQGDPNAVVAASTGSALPYDPSNLASITNWLASASVPYRLTRDAQGNNGFPILLQQANFDQLIVGRPALQDLVASGNIELVDVPGNQFVPGATDDAPQNPPSGIVGSNAIDASGSSTADTIDPAYNQGQGQTNPDDVAKPIPAVPTPNKDAPTTTQDVQALVQGAGLAPWPVGTDGKLTPTNDALQAALAQFPQLQQLVDSGLIAPTPVGADGGAPGSDSGSGTPGTQVDDAGNVVGNIPAPSTPTFVPNPDPQAAASSDSNVAPGQQPASDGSGTDNTQPPGVATTAPDQASSSATTVAAAQAAAEDGTQPQPGADQPATGQTIAPSSDQVAQVDPTSNQTSPGAVPGAGVDSATAAAAATGAGEPSDPDLGTGAGDNASLDPSQSSSTSASQDPNAQPPADQSQDQSGVTPSNTGTQTSTTGTDQTNTDPSTGNTPSPSASTSQSASDGTQDQSSSATQQTPPDQSGETGYVPPDLSPADQAANSQTSDNNPVTADTKIPTTGTPVTDAGAGAAAGGATAGSAADQTTPVSTPGATGSQTQPDASTDSKDMTGQGTSQTGAAPAGPSDGQQPNATGSQDAQGSGGNGDNQSPTDQGSSSSDAPAGSTTPPSGTDDASSPSNPQAGQPVPPADGSTSETPPNPANQPGQDAPPVQGEQADPQTNPSTAPSSAGTDNGNPPATGTATGAASESGSTDTPTTSTNPEGSPAIAKIEELLKGGEVSAAGKQVLQDILTYVREMKPKKPVQNEQLLRYQVMLYRALTGAVNRLEDDFYSVWGAILGAFDHHRDGAFAETHVFRGMANVPLSDTDRSAFQNIVNLAKATAAPGSRKAGLEQVDLERSTQHGLTEAGRNKLANFYDQ